MEELKAQMFDFGPLHENRHQICNRISGFLKTGDILYRASNAKGPYGLPFSRLLGRITDSHYSHAAIALIEPDGPYVLEINDQGTLKYRLIDWLDTCYTNHLAIYRLKKIDDLLRSRIEVEIRTILKEDPDYDFTFSDPNKFYCTESVAVIYNRVDILLIEPETIKEIVSSPITYWLLKTGNWIFGLVSDAALNFNEKMYYVGNEQKGLMSSDKTYCIYEHSDEI